MARYTLRWWWTIWEKSSYIASGASRPILLKFKEWRKQNIRLGRELTLHMRDQISRLNASIQFLWIEIFTYNSEVWTYKAQTHPCKWGWISSTVSMITNHLKSCPLVDPAVWSQADGHWSTLAGTSMGWSPQANHTLPLDMHPYNMALHPSSVSLNFPIDTSSPTQLVPGSPMISGFGFGSPAPSISPSDSASAIGLHSALHSQLASYNDLCHLPHHIPWAVSRSTSMWIVLQGDRECLRKSSVE